MSNWQKYLGIMGLAIVLVVNTRAATKDINVLYDGNLRTIIQEYKVEQKSFMLPIKGVAEILGYECKFDKASGKIELVDAGYIISFYKGKKEAEVNGRKITLSEAPQTIKGVTYVPLSFIEETMEMGAKWNSTKQQLELEGKYTVDQKNGKLMVRTKDGKKTIADIKCYLNQGLKIRNITLMHTDEGSELVQVRQWTTEEPTKYADAAYYIREGKVVDQAERPPSEEGASACMRGNHIIILFDGEQIKMYDDTSGKCIREMDVKALLGKSEFEMLRVSSQYVMGRENGDFYILDLITGKAVKIIDVILEKEGQMPSNQALQNLKDTIYIAWTTEEAIVVKYYCAGEKQSKIMTYKAGEGFSESQTVQK